MLAEDSVINRACQSGDRKGEQEVEKVQARESLGDERRVAAFDGDDYWRQEEGTKAENGHFTTQFLMQSENDNPGY